MTAGARRGITQRIARILANLVYREIDVHVAGDGIPEGPVVAVANHFGGLADGILLVDAATRKPRIVARDVIWRTPVVGRIASAVGMIPVHRRADGAAAGNDDMFATAYAALAGGDLLLIFPEGVTQDVPHMAPVRTGAARIALGARETGTSGIRVLPMGIHYEDKAGFRTRVLVNVGEAIDLDSWAAARPPILGGADDRDAVHELTELVDGALRHVAPDFPDWESARALQSAAEVLLTDVDPAPLATMKYGDLSLLASRLNRLPEPSRGELAAAASRYVAAVAGAGTSDLAVATTQGPRSWAWLADLLLVIALAPFALVGLLAAAVPLLLVSLVSRLRVAPAVRATAVPGAALLAFFAEWGLLVWRAAGAGGLGLALLVILLFPFFVAALLLFHERVALLYRRWRSRRRPNPADLPGLRALRAEVADRGWSAV